MKIMTQKQYKAAPPKETIERIRGIINHWELPVKEEILGDGRDFFSCRIYISDNEDSSIGTNGKGMNLLYALASGYAEFMERLQNRVIVYPNPASYNAHCRFFPDESPYHLEGDQVAETVKEYIPNSMPDQGLEIHSIDGVSIPFYHINDNAVKQIPYSLIRWVNGSNGMCAGNVPEEALIQGLCEIFERHCIQEMYIRKIVPPEIPLNIFKDTEVFRKLEKLRLEHGMDYSVKDYSLGEGFPVLGLLLFNPDKSKYILHLGADLNPIIALERCYTEIFQGYSVESLKFENDVNECERLNLFNEFKRSLMYGRGKQHEDFFTGMPSYEYNGHTTIPIGTNFSEDFNNICQWLIDKGYDIYIRDNSYLGFPTYHIVIPGLSEISNRFINLNRRLFHMQLTENRLNPLFNLRSISHTELNDTIKYLSMLDNDAVSLFPRNNNPANTVNRHILLALLNLKKGNNKIASDHLTAYIEYCNLKSRNPIEYYVDMLRLLSDDLYKGKNSDSLRIAKFILSNSDKILDYLNLPNCFDCECCQIKVGCRYKFLKELEDVCQVAMENNIPTQSTLSQLITV